MIIDKGNTQTRLRIAYKNIVTPHTKKNNALFASDAKREN
jgi:hypothetical protein